MTRKNSYVESNHARRLQKADSLYGSWKMTWFVRCMMLDGKYSIAYKQFITAMDVIIKKTNPGNLSANEKAEYGCDLFDKIIKKVRPLAKVTTTRIGGANYQVPKQVSERDGTRIAIGWIIKHARKRSGRSFWEKLSSEFLDILEGRGGSINERETAHKMAQANLAFGGSSSYFNEDQQ